MSLEAVWPVGAAADRLARSGTVPSSLVQSTVRSAAAMALGGAAIEGVVPVAVAALARVSRTLVFSRLRTAACLFILAAAGVSIGLAASHGPADEPARRAAVPAPAAAGQASATREEPARTRSSSAGRSWTPTASPSPARRSS